MKDIKSSTIVKVDRRTFLKTGVMGSTGLILGTQIACSTLFQEEPRAKATFSPNVFLTINEKGEITIVTHRSEMGTGIRTSLPAVVADELEADWNMVTIQQAIGDEETYGDQNTDGSYSIRMFYMPMRRVGAAAKMMLEQAAAAKWKVNVSECRAKNNNVVHEPSGKKFDFGELAGDASKLTVPEEKDIKLKDSKNFSKIGKSTPITDLKDIVTGKANFGLDTILPELKVAVIRRCPVAGGKVVSHNAEAALKVSGVQKVFVLESPGFPAGFNAPLGGVVVVADNTWAAIKGRDALDVEWDNGANGDYNSEEYLTDLVAKTKTSNTIRRENGDIKKALKGAGKILDSTYVLQHLSHTPMEPPCGVAYAQEGKCELWVPTQNPKWVQEGVAAALEIKKENVTVNVTLLGGGFGRKSKADFSVETAKISKEFGSPVKLLWTREDDIQHDLYHSCAVQRIKVGIDKANNVVAWNQKSVFPSIGGTATNQAIQPSGQELSLGAIDFPYNVENVCVESADAPAKTRIGWLRSVCNIQHAFAIGSMLDEIARARNMDPIENALDLLGEDRQIDKAVFGKELVNYGTEYEDYPWNTGRFRGVINEVAKKSNWGKELPKGRAQGFCAHRSFLTYVACVVEVEADENGNVLSIPEIHYAVDCGLAVNRDRVIAQFEGGAVFALSGALKGAITFKDGRVEQSNFHDYSVARMTDAPKNIFVHLIDSDEKPTGVGEPPVPPVAPALANAIYAASGKRFKNLPMMA
ncbi:molybdopterin cofactor-binding domain-containing protein [Reichenbachiella sp. MALMAid0571]|uniref:xanthine dehydrogenase family protein molybdopterin-binding subunit n=1 Tax=Reichenbachiella sp. MALMAid0571 TaxID=3143939 RepID=UPI0032DF34C0